MPEKTHFIREFSPGNRIADLFVLTEARLGQARNGPYWNLTLQDASGTVAGKIWSPLSRNFSELKSGSFVRVRGMVESFREQNQINVDGLEVLDRLPDTENPGDFAPSSAVPPAEMLEELQTLIKTHLSHPPLTRFCRSVLNNDEIRERFMYAPGAKSVHHAYIGGLLEHSLSVSRLCMSICDAYPRLDRQTLLTAAVFHDLGKAWELSSGLTRDYTDQGKLLGHIFIGLEKLEPFFKRAKSLDDGLVMQIKHLILSHHGEYEFGSPRLPQTPEALVLHHADNLDAKLNLMGNALDDLEGTEADWTPYLKFMERSIFRAVPAPDPKAADSGSEHGKTDKDDQLCLLPLKE